MFQIFKFFYKDITDFNIDEESKKGNIKVLDHPKVAKTDHIFGRTPLHNLAWLGKIETMYHPLSGSLKDDYGRTPLHFLAKNDKIQILSHPSVDKVRDSEGWTPLHILAERGNKAVLNHPSVDKVENPWGQTALHLLACDYKVTLRWLKKKYPQYDFREKYWPQGLMPSLVRKILKELKERSNAEKFIFEL